MKLREIYKDQKELMANTTALFMVLTSITFMLSIFAQQLLSMPASIDTYIKLLMLAIIVFNCAYCIKYLFRNIRYTACMVTFMLLLFLVSMFNFNNTETILSNGIFFETVIQGGLMFCLVSQVDDAARLMRYLEFYAKVVVLLGFFLLVVSNISSLYMAYGYKMLMSTIILLYAGMYKRNWLELLIGLMGVLAIGIGGSRWAAAIALLSFVIYYFIVYEDHRKKCIIVLVVITLAALAFLFKDVLIQLMVSVTESLGIYSRSINKLVAGTFSSNSHRLENIEYSISMLTRSPMRALFGYGVGGERYYFLRDLYYMEDSGYPHNIVLELLLQYGLLGGILICMGIIYLITKCFSRYLSKEAILISVALLAANIELLMSSSYLQSEIFFAWIGWGFACMRMIKMRKLEIIEEKKSALDDRIVEKEGINKHEDRGTQIVG